MSTIRITSRAIALAAATCLAAAAGMAAAQTGAASAPAGKTMGDKAMGDKAGKPPVADEAAKSGVATKKPAKAGAQLALLRARPAPRRAPAADVSR